MPDFEDTVAEHYSRQPELIETILDAVEAAGGDRHAPIPEQLAGVDEFHLGGRRATAAVLDAIAAAVDGPPRDAFDAGCGIGGPARAIARLMRATVYGVDLTPSFVTTARRLSELVGLEDRTSFEVGSILSVDRPDASFDLATLFHVGMNIDDKAALFTELARLVRPGGLVAVYDVMRLDEGTIEFPVPWASDADMSHVATPAEYADAMTAAGLRPEEPVDRRDVAKAALAAGPQPVNLGHLMGVDFGAMFTNLVSAVGAGIVAPVQVLARRP